MCHTDVRSASIRLSMRLAQDKYTAAHQRLGVSKRRVCFTNSKLNNQNIYVCFCCSYNFHWAKYGFKLKLEKIAVFPESCSAASVSRYQDDDTNTRTTNYVAEQMLTGFEELTAL